MPVEKTEKIWHNGKWILWDDAKLHVLSHAVGYGSAVFEGIRTYETPQGPAIFRLREHMQRLINSGKIYRMEFAFSLDDFCNAACELVRLNKMGACYVKPIALRGYGEVGVNPLNSPIEIYMACWKWGAYLGPDALSKGVDVCVSSWTRIAPNTLPAMSKAAANYMNSQLIRMEAALNGFAEGIALDSDGHVSEGSGMNVFVVHDGTLYTPPLAASILPGITRDSIVKLAEDLGIPVKESIIPRESRVMAGARLAALLGRREQARREFASLRLAHKHVDPVEVAATQLALGDDRGALNTLRRQPAEKRDYISQRLRLDVRFGALRRLALESGAADGVN